jgi:hypothetical protein
VAERRRRRRRRRRGRMRRIELWSAREGRTWRVS